jgi:hypothetical protein
MFTRLRAETGSDGLLAELRAFLESPAVNQRTDDDKTLVLATRLPAAARPRKPRSRRKGSRAHPL